MTSILVFSLFNKSQPIEFTLLEGETLQQLYPKFISQMQNINQSGYMFPPFEEVLVVSNSNKTIQIKGDDCFEDILKENLEHPYQIYIVFPEEQTKSVIYVLLNEKIVNFAQSYDPNKNVIAFLKSLPCLKFANLQACYMKINGKKKTYNQICQKTLIKVIDELGCKIVCFNIIESMSQNKKQIKGMAEEEKAIQYKISSQIFSSIKNKQNSIKIFIQFQAENGNNISLICKQSSLNLERTLMSQLQGILDSLREEGFDWPYLQSNEAIYRDKLKILINKTEYRQYRQKLGVKFKPGQIQNFKIERVYQGG